MSEVESQILKMLTEQYGNRPLLPREVAEVYRKSPNAMAIMRHRGGQGPAYIVIGGNRVAYLPQDVAADLAARRRVPVAA